jgi:hypothetical protein
MPKSERFLPRHSADAPVTQRDHLFRYHSFALIEWLLLAPQESGHSA